VVASRDPRADAVIASVDAASEGLMRTILRSPAFRALESAWRGVHQLVTCEACGEGVEVHVLDAPQSRVAADLDANAQALERSNLARAVLGDPDGSVNKRWALVVGAYSFGADAASLRLSAGLGAIARRAGGGFIAHAEASLLGCTSFAATPSHTDWAPLPGDAAAAWSALRRSADAAWIALASPRVLMRQPYGRKSDPTERFAFEEVPAEYDANAMPWGHPGFALAQLLAQSFQAAGFRMEPGDHHELDDRPAYTYVSDGEKQMAPCAEAFLSEAATSAMLDRGVLAIASVRNRPDVRVPRFQSIADPPATLAGPWS
jgi:type VI secretion system protein ImpC